MLKQVEIFTDGSCLGNPGPGGYGAILRYRGREKTFSAGYTRTTNNRMELMKRYCRAGGVKRTLRSYFEYRQPVCPPGYHPVDP